MAGKQHDKKDSYKIGLFCRQPILIITNSLSELEKGNQLEVLCNDQTTKYTVPDLCRKKNYKLLEAEEKQGLFRFIIKK